MGCDIHTHIEVKINDKWEHYSCPALDRNYLLFARICGVRNYENQVPISNPRGLPDNISPVTKLVSEEGGHSATWLSMQEIITLIESSIDWDYRKIGYVVGNRLILDGVIFSDVRMICWFDN
jgi:hypothetical protein